MTLLKGSFTRRKRSIAVACLENDNVARVYFDSEAYHMMRDTCGLRPAGPFCGHVPQSTQQMMFLERKFDFLFARTKQHYRFNSAATILTCRGHFSGDVVMKIHGFRNDRDEGYSQDVTWNSEVRWRQGLETTRFTARMMPEHTLLQEASPAGKIELENMFGVRPAIL